jgi:hypothetical protein
MRQAKETEMTDNKLHLAIRCGIFAVIVIAANLYA